MRVIIGNPPYNVRTARHCIDNDIPDFYYCGIDKYGRLIKIPDLQNCSSIHDTYLKFIKYSIEAVEEQGIVGIITNSGFIDNFKLMGVRWRLLNEFDEIYIVDLKGNERKNGQTGKNKGKNKDENIFGIRVGVCIIFMIRKDKRRPVREYKNQPECVVWYKSLRGRKADKLKWLSENSLNTTEFTRVEYQAPGFVLNAEYNINSIQNEWNFYKVFKMLKGGVQSGADKMCIHMDEAGIERVLEDFRNLSNLEILNKYNIQNNVSYNIDKARACVVNNTGRVVGVQFRPFDIRYTYYTRSSGFLRNVRESCYQVLDGNYFIGINLDCSTETSVAFVSNRITCSNATCAFTYVAPVLIKEGGKVVENLEEDFRLYINSLYTVPPSALQVVYYIYSAFFNTEYKQLYLKYSKNNFNIIRFVKDEGVFYQACKYGEELVKYHLLDFDIDKVEGQGRIDFVRYKEAEGRLYINSEKSFDIDKEVWRCAVGGYRMLGTYLRNRKGMILDYHYYTKMIRAHEKTIELTKLINTIDYIN